MARIIIADDNHVSRLILKKLLEVFDHELIFGENGQEAVNAFRQQAAELVLLDVNMPVMDGVEACREIRRLPGGASVPIVMISAVDDESDIEKALDAGANDYLLKPVKQSHLLAKLRVFLRIKALHQNDFDLAKNRTIMAGRYRLIKLVGYGTHAIVFQAQDTAAADHLVAFKLFRDAPGVTDIYDAFAATAQRLQNLDSPHVLRIRDYGRCDGRLFVVMEYADGGDLARQLKAGPISQAAAVKIGLDVAQGIRDIAQAGVVHFDIKPENIMINGGHYVLADFGVPDERANATMGMKAEVWGTIAYLAPEYLTRGHTVPGKSDLYSLGVTLYQALTGSNPFFAERAASAMFCQVHFVPPALVVLNRELDAELSEMIAAMMAKTPEPRPEIEVVTATFCELKRRFAEDQTKHVPLDMPPVPRELIIETPADLFSHELPQHTPPASPGKDVPPAHETAHAAVWPLAMLTRAGGWASRQLAAYRALIIAVIWAAMIAATGLFVVNHLLRRAEPNIDVSGVLTVLQCLDCGQVLECRIHGAPDNEPCPACHGRMGTAYACAVCRHQFAFDESQPAQLDGSDYRCPKCGSTETSPALTSEEYRAAMVSANRREEDVHPPEDQPKRE